MSAQRPLCIDLDGTLLRTDVLIESFLELVKVRFWFVFLLPFALFKGKAQLKTAIAERIELDVATLPFNDDVIALAQARKAQGARLVLVTATTGKFARQIATHLGLFDEVIASGPEDNLKGPAKLEVLRTRFGEKGFDYVGNDRSDLEVWPHSEEAVVVNATPAVQREARRTANVTRVIRDDHAGWKSYLRALRPHQWLKNLLVFLPLVAAHQLTDLYQVVMAGVAFVAFGLCASSVYLLNDLLDLASDRQHPRKRLRPFASGAIPLQHGLMLIPALLVPAVLVSLILPPQFLGVLGVYYAITLGYSLGLKKVVLVDVLLLAVLYTLRIIAGAAAISLVPSFWLLAFSMFLFLSLAMIKRYTELLAVCGQRDAPLRGRGYRASDMQVLQSMGTASGYLAVLVLAFYINSDMVGESFAHPEVIWLLCPLLLYWISRMWLGAARDKMHDDPLVFAVKDKVSRWIGLLAVAIFSVGALL